MTGRLPSWTTDGAHVHDAGEGRIGIAKLLGGGSGAIAAGQPIQHATQTLPRPVDRQAPLWWAQAGNLQRAAR
ncbi:hypothetical protein LKL35_12155 [Streptomyces sp. ET3-23]|uniref:hypothetical protein n=1 Tax=Streptomyces sp. ET3-23 TaxID=2885643 RepID=UPI001D12EC28|nr:hypothetical protein [Streptomyces sp. ET3-23]MCC2276162.1 hypothetical protein [Streptomyces sp. ET3-23]